MFIPHRAFAACSAVALEAAVPLCISHQLWTSKPLATGRNRDAWANESPFPMGKYKGGNHV